MSVNACENCLEILDRKTSKKHSDLIRNGLSQSVGHHGSRDDEYYYRCKICNTSFIGDSMGIRPARN